MSRWGKFAVPVLAAVLTGSVLAAGPTLAGVVASAFDANNAHKVDGKHAVGFSASIDARKGKLVATSTSTGRLPNNIIGKAPNADKLDGQDSSAYVRDCEEGSVLGYAWVIAPNGTYDTSTIPSTFTPIFRNYDYNCSGGQIYVRRDGVGQYYVGFGGLFAGVAIANADTVYGENDVYVNASRALAGPDNGSAFSVVIRDHTGAFTDSPFLITVM
jgi:hypothetical protein